ncbi:MAG: PH domain-containing protein [Propionibacteriaceae bacterium]
MTDADHADPFTPPNAAWQPLAPAAAALRRIGTLISMLILCPLAATAIWFFTHCWWLATVVGALLGLWHLWRISRAKAWAKAWGWCERDDDFCARWGLLHRNLAIIPIGRVQQVKISAGPFLRWKNLAAVEIITASGDLAIPYLAADVAADLRDRLIAKSDAHGTGL